MLSNAIFVVTALAFVPLHALVGRNIAIPLIALVAFVIGESLAVRSLGRGRAPRGQAMLSLSLNALSADKGSDTEFEIGV
jgi:hypothetical protein